MQRSPFCALAEDLPPAISVFPLSGALLLPGQQLPLNVFEPRYLSMILDALGEGRLIGMVQPRPGSDAEPTELCRVGCAGRISAFSETADGRLLITLSGVCRYALGRELQGRRGYRRVQPLWDDFLSDLEAPPPPGLDAAALESTLRAYFGIKGLEVSWDALRQLDELRLVDVLAMSLPLASSDKQSLLEAGAGPDRARLFKAFLEMQIAAGERPGETRH